MSAYKFESGLRPSQSPRFGPQVGSGNLDVTVDNSSLKIKDIDSPRDYLLGDANGMVALWKILDHQSSGVSNQYVACLVNLRTANLYLKQEWAALDTEPEDVGKWCRGKVSFMGIARAINNPFNSSETPIVSVMMSGDVNCVDYWSSAMGEEEGDLWTEWIPSGEYVGFCIELTTDGPKIVPLTSRMDNTKVASVNRKLYKLQYWYFWIGVMRIPKSVSRLSSVNELKSRDYCLLHLLKAS